MKNLIYLITAIMILLLVGCGSPKEQDKKQSEKAEPAKEQVDQTEAKKETTEEQTPEKTDELEKPDKFPAEALEQVEGSVAEGDPVLSLNNVDLILQITKEFAGKEQVPPEELDKIMKERGLKGFEEFKKIYMAAMMSTSAIKSLEAMQAIIDASEDEKKAAESITLDDAMISMATQTLLAGKFTEEDLHLIYDNWDKFASFKKEVEKLNKQNKK